MTKPGKSVGDGGMTKPEDPPEASSGRMAHRHEPAVTRLHCKSQACEAGLWGDAKGPSSRLAEATLQHDGRKSRRAERDLPSARASTRKTAHGGSSSPSHAARRRRRERTLHPMALRVTNPPRPAGTPRPSCI